MAVCIKCAGEFEKKDNRNGNTCPTCRRKYSKQYYAKHKEKIKEKRRHSIPTIIYSGITQIRRRSIKLIVLRHYSGSETPCCKKCGYDKDLRALTIDHINNGGAQHRRTIRCSGSSFYRWLIEKDYPEGYQVLCMNCQFIKEIERRQQKEFA